MSNSITTDKPRAVYVTARDARTGRSKTITLRGDGLTTKVVIKLIVDAIDPRKRKAG